MFKKDIYYFKKVLKKYKVYYYFKKGLHECIEEYTQYTYHPTWKQIIGKVWLENNGLSILSLQSYLSTELNLHYSIPEVIRIVINYTPILQEKVTQEKVVNEICQEMMKND